MFESDISLWKLNHPLFKSFLEKYTKNVFPIGNQSTIRKNRFSTIHKNTISRISLLIGDGVIWISLDKTTDVDNRFVCNFIIDLLHDEHYLEP